MEKTRKSLNVEVADRKTHFEVALIEAPFVTLEWPRGVRYYVMMVMWVMMMMRMMIDEGDTFTELESSEGSNKVIIQLKILPGLVALQGEVRYS